MKSFRESKGKIRCRLSLLQSLSPAFLLSRCNFSGIKSWQPYEWEELSLEQTACHYDKRLGKESTCFKCTWKETHTHMYVGLCEHLWSLNYLWVICEFLRIQSVLFNRSHTSILCVPHIGNTANVTITVKEYKLRWEDTRICLLPRHYHWTCETL